MKTIPILMIAILAFGMVAPFVAAEDVAVNDGTGETEVTVVDAGITPDSPLYGLERAMERIHLAFVRNKLGRAKLKLRFAEERLAETEKMIEVGNDEAAQEAQEAHDETLAEVEDDVQEIESDGNEQTAEIALGDVEQLQLRLLSHAERVAYVHQRILTKLSEENASEKQIAHLTNVFGKIEAKSQEVEKKVAQKRENIRTRYKVLSEKPEDELTNREKSFITRVEKATELKQKIQTRIKERIKSRLNPEEESEASTEDQTQETESGEEEGDEQSQESQ